MKIREYSLVSVIWLILAVTALVGALFFGAWHHLASAGFCLLLFLASKEED